MVVPFKELREQVKDSQVTGYLLLEQKMMLLKTEIGVARYPFDDLDPIYLYYLKDVEKEEREENYRILDRDMLEYLDSKTDSTKKPSLFLLEDKAVDTSLINSQREYHRRMGHLMRMEDYLEKADLDQYVDVNDLYALSDSMSYDLTFDDPAEELVKAVDDVVLG